MQAALYELTFLALLALPLALTVGFARCLWHERSRGPRRPILWAVALVLATLPNPVVQPFFLEPVDRAAGARLASAAADAGLVGMDASRARGLLGEPDEVRVLASGGALWEYRQLPGYWLGSRFDVRFEDGRVISWQANDD